MSKVFNIRHMAEPFLNAVCDLVMISGEPEFVAPYVGISAQIDVMQEFMEGDLMPILEAGGTPDPPEIAEFKGEVNKSEAEASSFLDTLEYKLMPGSTTPVFRGGIASEDEHQPEQTDPFFNVERIIQELTQQFGEMRSRGEEESDPPQTPAKPKSWGFEAIVPLLIAVATVISQFGEQICNGIKVIMPGLAKIAAAVSKHSPQVARIIAKLSPAAAVGLTPVLIGFSEKFKTIATVLGTIAQMVSEFMQTYMMVKQFQNLNDYARYLSPETGMFIDTITSVDDVLWPQAPPPPDEPENPDNPDLPETPVNTFRGVRGTVTPATVKPNMTVKVPNITDPKEFTLNTGMRNLTKTLPTIEALLKKLIMSLNSKIDPVDGPPKVYSITDILYNSLNYTPPKGSTGTLGGPPHEWSLAEIMSKGIPIIETVDPITKKKTQISVFELIMQAQSAKVVELGPGFLKWYTDLDVLQNNQAVTETPKSGT